MASVESYEKEFSKIFNDALRQELLMGSWVYKPHEMYEDRYRSGSTISYWHADPLSATILEKDQRTFGQESDESLSNYIARWYSNFNIQEEHNMYVFDVVVVYKPDDEIIYDNSITASTSEQAKLFALADIMRESAPKNEVIANYHFAVKQVGEGYSK